MLAIIILATIMALFGVLGYQRGTRSSLCAGGLVLLGLLGLSRLGGNLAATLNGLVLAVKLAFSGELQTAGSAAGQRAELDRLVDAMTQEQTLARPDGTGLGMVLLFVAVVALAYFIGGRKWFHGKPSGLGLLAGLATGYLIAAYLINRLFAGSIALPLPFGLNAATHATELTPANLALADGSALAREIARLVSVPFDEGSLALALVVGIALFVLLATRLANRKG